MTDSGMTGLVPSAGLVLMQAATEARQQVRLASPYISAGVAHELAGIAKDGSANWSILTSLDAAAVAHGSLSIQGLRALRDASVELRTASNLHAKLFLCDPVFGLVGSANLTHAGLGSGQRANLELGFLLPRTTLGAAADQFASWWAKSDPVTEQMLAATEEAAAKLPASVPVPAPSNGAGNPITAEVEAANALLAEAGGVALWVKALYRDAVTADDPWRSDSFVNSSKKGKPSFAVGDLLLIYAKAAGRCNAVVQVAGSTRHDVPFLLAQGVPQASADRWPWVTPVSGRLQVPVATGVPLSALGFTGLSLQGGHKRLGLSEFAAALRYLSGRP
ncbi:phospholipase D-like domain-containing protein [Nocardioides zhouii]|uniref:Phosphatidylserine/phosphatidylglycerophosphate/ cardiolipin synthase family protein n=1 Tax=Nocardioides zhouii TaxID=1168729 RepID=A0A4Q2TCV8_9ACTN|nr:phospholipase D-like domain-containing protein [Nocardioides zhouii]RYC14769.1 phosphatidylserine/phosphatidylglycerophosphate/cardiolipin synthase family protein [Nocardioides zhouii]